MNGFPSFFTLCCNYFYKDILVFRNVRYRFKMTVNCRFRNSYFCSKFIHRKPYIIIQRQRSQFSEMYPSEVGLPLNVMMTLGSCVGLTKADSAHLNTIPCSVEGQNKISSLLAEGIIL